MNHATGLSLASLDAADARAPRMRAPRRAFELRGAYLCVSIALHVLLGVVFAVCVAAPRGAIREPRTFTLAVAPEIPVEVEATHDAQPADEPERVVLAESLPEPLTEPRLVELVVPIDPLDDVPSADAKARNVADPRLIAVEFLGTTPWPRTGRALVAARDVPGRPRVSGSQETSPVPRGMPPAAAPPGVFVAARPDPARAPSPDYPRLARLRGWQGTVLLEVALDAQGRPQAAQVRESSGRRLLDDAAREAVLAWRFLPATRDGVAEASRVLVPIVWRLVEPAAAGIARR